jgi:hypothetical protein
MEPMPALFPLGVMLVLAAAPPSPSPSASPRAPSYTDADLKAARDKGKGAFSHLEGQPAASPSPSPGASPSAEPDRALQEKKWRARFAAARARIAEAEARSYEERIEVVFVSGIPVQQTVRVKVETEELRQARKALDDLEDELRRSGGLPGWGREG